MNHLLALRKRFVRILFVATTFACYCGAHAATSLLLLDGSHASYSLGELVEFHEDRAANLDLREISQLPENAWQQHTKAIPNFGFSRSAYWFRIRLQNTQALKWLLAIDYPLLDEIALYTLDGERPVQTVQTGDSRPFIDRPLKQVTFAFPLTLPSTAPATVYLRVKSTGTVQVPIKLWQEHAYYEHEETITAITGVYFGILLIMVLYNLFVYLMVREPAHIHYVLFVTTIGLFAAGLYGWGYKYLWPQAVLFQQYNTAVFISLSLVFASRFIHHFLDLPRTAPGVALLLLGVVLSQLAALILLPVVGYHWAIQFALVMTLVTVLTALYAGILLWQRGERAARYFTIAWSTFLFSALLATLEKFGLIPSTFWADFSLPLGVISIVSLLSLALAERINLEKQQRIQAQQQLIHLQEQNQEELEQKVKQRTVALGQANQSLEKELVERRAAELALHDSEERFRKAFQYSAVGMALVGLDGHWLRVNGALCQIVGYSQQELLSKTFQDITHPDDLQSDLAFVAQLLAGTKDHYQMEKRYFHKDGHVVWIRLSVALIRDAQEKPIHFVTQIEDITEDMLAQERIRQLNEELETKVQQRTQQLLAAQEELVRKEKLAVLGQVAGSVGHELRNPLGVMSNAVYFLQTVLPDADETTKEYLAILKNEIADSERIVSDLLDSVRTKPPQAGVVAVLDLVHQILRKYSVPASVNVKLDIPETLPPLRVDPQQIQQVLRNLISNAVEAMPEGGTLEISALENRADGTITVRVRDSGVGMTLEQLGKLFQPLFTTKARGIGLGLVVVKNLTQANGGSVQVHSELGKGSEFSVTLPCASPAGGAA